MLLCNVRDEEEGEGDDVDGELEVLVNLDKIIGAKEAAILFGPPVLTMKSSEKTLVFDSVLLEDGKTLCVRIPNSFTRKKGESEVGSFDLAPLDLLFNGTFSLFAAPALVMGAVGSPKQCRVVFDEKRESAETYAGTITKIFPRCISALGNRKRIFCSTREQEQTLFKDLRH